MTLREARRRVNGRLLEAGNTLAEPNREVVTYLAGGKRFRAELLLLVSMASGDEVEERAVRYAAFVEIVHAGGLCHDDIVDRSEFRRGQPSIASVGGTREAMLVGLVLMSHAYGLVACDEDPVRAAVSRAATRVARGQADEMTGLFDATTSPERYLDRCRDKTGALFELSAELGALVGRLESGHAEGVVRFAQRVGLAFQLADDLRDFFGDAVLGRERGIDLREGVYTLPVLMMLHENRPGAHELRQVLDALRAAASPRDIVRLTEAACHLLESEGAMSSVRSRAEHEVSDACDELAECSLPLRTRMGDFARSVLFGLLNARAVA
jgi:geranylgeranyl pyrophosphate synthase